MPVSAGLFFSCHSSSWCLLLLYIPLFTLMHTPGKRESKGAGIAKANAGEEGAGDEDWGVGGGGGGLAEQEAASCQRRVEERKGGGGGGGGAIASVSEGADSAHLHIGEEVEARMSGKKWYPAQITSKVHELGQLFYVITYHQATKGRAQVTPQQVQRSSDFDWCKHMALQPLSVGERVKGRFRHFDGEKLWFPGVVAQVTEDTKLSQP
jgi:hypothetical protein